MKKLFLLIVILAISSATIAWVRYGGGEAYPNLLSTPLLNQSSLEEVLRYPEPLGNVAVSEDGRVFFTVHSEARPDGNKLLEFVDGAAEPWPDGKSQQTLYDTPLGIVADGQGRLWVIDHGNHGLRQPRLLGFDIASGELIADERFNSIIAPTGSFLQDLAVSPDGETIVIGDSSYWRKSPALIVYEIESGSTRRVLESHPSVSAEKYVIESNNREMSFLGGIVTLRGGVNGIAMDEDWVYFGAISGSGLYRVPLQDLTTRYLPDSQLAAAVEYYATKPLSDGFAIDSQGTVYVTDVEHHAVYRIGPDRKARTLIQSKSIRWPEGITVGPDGWLYVTDSALPDIVLSSADDIRSQGPFVLYRLRLVTSTVSNDREQR
ncbi:MAG: L-dopachrome tautomerase-related protein [Pseudomonadota bacterium]